MFYSIILVVFAQFVFAKGWVINDVSLRTRYQLEKLGRPNNSTKFSDETNEDYSARLAFIYPGTKWCGAGNIANNFNDLGSEWKADKCCRDHDYCPDFIPAGETMHNLTNEAFYTRLSCECDEAFRNCLHEAKTVAADNVGLFYFNALSTKCYRVDYPKRKCLKKGGWLNNKCLAYSYDRSSDKMYQWFDVNNYR